MTTIPPLLFACAAGCILWSYVGYPVWLYALSRVRNRPIRSRHVTPTVSLIISAFNEVGVIASKIENSLQLDYPNDSLEILVISDASDDGTDDVVQSYASRGVRLLRQSERRGKSAGLTEFAPSCSGDILVFSDANAMYEPDAIRQLTQHFHDETVGYVVGSQNYVESLGSTVSESEGLYWRYESWIKAVESQTDSVVGGDGAIYAIRKRLFFPLRVDDINDFINPLQIIARGYRGVYESNAVCFEHTSTSFRGEFRRKIRIVNRSMRALFRVPAVLNPFRVGVFAFHVVSHKLLRWFTAYFMLVALVSNIIWQLHRPGALPRLLLVTQIVLYACAFAGAVPRLGSHKVFYVPFYFVLANVAAAIGVMQYFVGARYVTWTPDRVVGSGSIRRSRRGDALLATVFAALAFLVGLAIWFPIAGVTACSFVLAYTYVFYPLIMFLVPKRMSKMQASSLPSLAVVIPAHNEIDVIEAKLQNTLEILYPRDSFEVYIVDDDSDDGTGEVLQGTAFESVNVIRQASRQGKSSAIAAAVEQTDAEVLLLTDANVFVDPDAAQILTSHLADKQVGCVTGNVRLASPTKESLEAESTYQSFETQLQQRESDFNSAVSVDGGLYVVRRDAFRPPPSDAILDDFVISAEVLNAGYRIVADTEAKANESSSPNVYQEFRRRVRMAEGAVQVMRRGQFVSPHRTVTFWQFLSHKLFRWLSPAVMVVLAFAAVMSTRQSNLAWYLVGSGLFVMLVAALGLSSNSLRRSNTISVLSFFVLVQAAILVGMIRGLLRAPSAVWEHANRFAPEQKQSTC